MPSLAFAPLWVCFCSASCSQPGDHNLNDLDKARVDVEEAMQVLAEWNMDSVAAAKGRVAMRFKDLDWLMADTTMTFGVDDAQLIGHWERVRRFFKKTLPSCLHFKSKENVVLLPIERPLEGHPRRGQRGRQRNAHGRFLLRQGNQART